MGQDIDYSIVEAKVAAMKDIAGKIEECKMAMNFYYCSTVDLRGEFAKSFYQMKSDILSIVSDMESFINDYADLIDCVAKNFATFDSEMKEQVGYPYGMMA